MVATAQSSTSLLLNWVDTSTNEQGFTLEYKQSSSSSWSGVQGASALSAGTTSFTHSSLSASTAYDYRVRSYNSIGSSAWSPTAQGTTGEVSGGGNSGGTGGGGGGGGGSSSGGGGGSSGGGASNNNNNQGNNPSRPGSQMTIAELQNLLTSLRATLLALLEQRALLQAGQSPIVSAAFTRDLTVGSEGPDVRSLQIYLNTHGFVITSVGVGSPGNEGTYFGDLTRAALARLQRSKGVVPALGYFGPKTRALIGQ